MLYIINNYVNRKSQLPIMLIFNREYWHFFSIYEGLKLPNLDIIVGENTLNVRQEIGLAKPKVMRCVPLVLFLVRIMWNNSYYSLLCIPHTSIAFFLGTTSFSIIMIGGAIYSLLPDRFSYERGVFSDGEKLDS